MSESQTQELINKKLIFHIERCIRRLCNEHKTIDVEIDIDNSYFSSIKINISESIPSVNGFYNESLNANATTGVVDLSYTRKHVSASLPSSSGEFNFSQQIKEDWEPPYVFEEKYLEENKWIEKWKSGNISKEEAKKIIIDLAEYFFSDDVLKETESPVMIQGIFDYIKESLNENYDYENVEVKDT